VKLFAGIAFVLLMGGSSIIFADPALFSVQNGGIVITGQNTATAGTQGNPWTLNETMTAAGTIALRDADGTPLGPQGTVGAFFSGSWIKALLNIRLLPGCQLYGDADSHGFLRAEMT